MKWIIPALVLAFAPISVASAAVISLESITANGSNYTFSYQGTLGPDEGADVQSGSKLIIFDFAGYVPGSIFSTIADLMPSTELFSNTAFIIPGQTDDPTIENLVFTWTGPDFQTSGGPYAPIDFDGLGADSIYRNTILDAFTTWTVKNNPAGAEGTLVITLGEDLVPSAVPEPAAWATLTAGFGLLGAAVRRRRNNTPVNAHTFA